MEKKLDMAKLEAAQLETQKIYELARNEKDMRKIDALCERIKKLAIIKIELTIKIKNPSNY